MRKKNPVQPSKIKRGLNLFQKFTGHNGEIFSISAPEVPEVMLVVGECDGIMYTTVRDGKTEKYLHQFKKTSRPLLLASHDGKMLYLLGGAYDFTDSGIVDRK